MHLGLLLLQIYQHDNTRHNHTSRYDFSKRRFSIVKFMKYAGELFGGKYGQHKKKNILDTLKRAYNRDGGSGRDIN